jgi:iron complex outermembrane recepter protein
MLKKHATTTVLLAGSMSVLSSVAIADDAAPPPQPTANAKPAEHAELMEELVITAKFVSEDAKSAMKQDVGVLDTPVSVDRYSASFLRAIETTKVTDLYSYMTGVQRGGATGYDLSIRGFKTTQTDKNAIMVDGLPGLTTRYGSPPTVAFDSIELVRGPASVLYGQEQPGGFINMITKKPSATAAGVVSVQESRYAGDGISIGKDPGIVSDLDFTGPLNSGHTLLYRVVGEYVDSNSFRHDVYQHSYYVAPSLSLIPTESTTLTLAVEVSHRESSLDDFLVAPNNDVHLIAPRTTVYQSPNDILPEYGRSETLTLDQAITSDINWHTAFRSVTANDSEVGYDQNTGINNASVFLIPATKTQPAEWVVQRRARQQYNKRTYNYLDSNVAIPFFTGPVEHKLLVGINGGVDTTDFDRIQFYNGPTPNTTPPGKLYRPGPQSINVTVYDPITYISPPITSFPLGNGLTDRYTRSESNAEYLSDLVTLADHWKLNLGLRYFSERQHGFEQKLVPRPAPNNHEDQKFIPAAGLLFEPNDSWTLYTNYTKSYVPVPGTAQDVNGRYSFKPSEAHEVEVGTKLYTLQNRLSVTAAVFDIHSQNVTETVTCNPGVTGTCVLQVGEEHSKGGELEINTHFFEGWQALLGYSYTDAYVQKSDTNSTSPLVGDRLTNSSKNNVHFWSRYDVGSGPLKGLGGGLGAFYVSSHAGTLPSAADSRLLLLPGYTVVDAVVYYSLFGRYEFTFKVGNLTNKLYYEGVNSTTNAQGIVPGSPRYLQLSARVPLY